MNTIQAIFVALLAFGSIMLAYQRGQNVTSTASAATLTNAMRTVNMQSATIAKQSAVIDEQSDLIKVIERQRDEALSMVKAR